MPGSLFRIPWRWSQENLHFVVTLSLEGADDPETACGTLERDPVWRTREILEVEMLPAPTPPGVIGG